MAGRTSRPRQGTPLTKSHNTLISLDKKNTFHRPSKPLDMEKTKH